MKQRDHFNKNMVFGRLLLKNEEILLLKNYDIITRKMILLVRLMVKLEKIINKSGDFQENSTIITHIPSSNCETKQS